MTARTTPSRALVPVGALEIAEQLDVAYVTVRKWLTRDVGFPAPRWTVGGNPAWNLPDVLRWARQTGRV